MLASLCCSSNTCNLNLNANADSAVLEKNMEQNEILFPLLEIAKLTLIMIKPELLFSVLGEEISLAVGSVLIIQKEL